MITYPYGPDKPYDFSKPLGHALNPVPPVHVPSLLEDLGVDPNKDKGTWSGNEFCTSIDLYLAGDTKHPLVRKYGWGEMPKRGGKVSIETIKDTAISYRQEAPSNAYSPQHERLLTSIAGSVAMSKVTL